MMRNRLLLALFFVFLAMPLAQAQMVEDDSTAEPVYQRYHGTLNDFKKIYIQCAATDSGFQLTSGLCALVEMESRTAARGTNLRVEPGNNEGKDGLTLSVKLDVIEGGLSAISVLVEVSRQYQEAVDKDASSNHPAATPRAGRMVFFSNSFTALGRGDMFDETVRGKLRGTIRQFFRTVESER